MAPNHEEPAFLLSLTRILSLFSGKQSDIRFSLFLSFSLYFIRVYNATLPFPFFLVFLKVIIYSLSFYFISRENTAGYKLYLKRGVESCACLGTRIAFESLCAVEIIWRRGKVVLWVNRLNYLRGFRGFVVVEEWISPRSISNFSLSSIYRAPTYF